MDTSKHAQILAWAFAFIAFVLWITETKWRDTKLSRLKKTTLIICSVLWGIGMVWLTVVTYKGITQQASLQKPIMSISAAAQFTVPGLTNFAPVPEAVKKMGGVARFECVGKSQGVQNVLCLQSEQVRSELGPPVGLGLPTNTTTFLMDLHLNPKLSKIDLQKAQAGLIDKLEAPVFEEAFLPSNCLVITGSVVLTINDVRTEFPMPLQRKNLTGITCLPSNR